MKSYNENKFKSLDEPRKWQVLYQLLKSVEAKGLKNSESEVQILQSYLGWLEAETESRLHKLSRFKQSLGSQAKAETLYSLIVEVERHLTISVKDHEFLQSQHDKLQPQKPNQPLILVLDHLRSAFNVGSLFRTAECLGVSEIHLIGYTPTPDTELVQKTAMGTETLVPWSHYHSLNDCLLDLRKRSYKIVGLELGPEAEILSQWEAPKPLALVLGNERFGLTPEKLKTFDHQIFIPMQGQKNSMNVATCAGVALHEIFRQWGSL